MTFGFSFSSCRRSSSVMPCNRSISAFSRSYLEQIMVYLVFLLVGCTCHEGHPRLYNTIHILYYLLTTYASRSSLSRFIRFNSRNFQDSYSVSSFSSSVMTSVIWGTFASFSLSSSIFPLRSLTINLSTSFSVSWRLSEAFFLASSSAFLFCSSRSLSFSVTRSVRLTKTGFSLGRASSSESINLRKNWHCTLLCS